MGLLLRFPLERARAVPPSPAGGQGAEIIVLPVIRIERSAGTGSKKSSKTRTRGSNRPRRRTQRPA